MDSDWLIGKNIIEPLKVVDHTPFTTAFFHFAAPIFHAGHIRFGIDVVTAKLGYVQRDDIIIRQLKERGLAGKYCAPYLFLINCLVSSIAEVATRVESVRI